jgi:hypothetical protein
MTDYERCNPSEIRKVCAQNRGTLKFATQVWVDDQRKNREDKAERLRRIDATEREFRNWALKYLAPYEELYGRLDEKTEAAVKKAASDMSLLLSTWSVIEGITTLEERGAVIASIDEGHVQQST